MIELPPQDIRGPLEKQGYAVIDVGIDVSFSDELADLIAGTEPLLLPGEVPQDFPYCQFSNGNGFDYDLMKGKKRPSTNLHTARTVWNIQRSDKYSSGFPEALKERIKSIDAAMTLRMDVASAVDACLAKSYDMSPNVNGPRITLFHYTPSEEPVWKGWHTDGVFYILSFPGSNGDLAVEARDGTQKKMSLEPTQVIAVPGKYADDVTPGMNGTRHAAFRPDNGKRRIGCIAQFSDWKQ